MLKHLMVFVVVVGLVLPTSAQRSDEELIERVTNGYAAFETEASYAYTVSRTWEQVIGVDVGGDTQELDQTIAYSGAGAAHQNDSGTYDYQLMVDMMLNSAIGQMQITDFEYSMEAIAVNGSSYFRFDNLPAELQDVLPAEWTDGEALDDDAISLFSLVSFAPDNRFAVSAETIDAIDELPSDTIDGQEMRVIRFTQTPEAFGLDVIVSTMQLEAFGADEAMLTEIIESASIETTVWINPENGLIYQLENLLTITGLMFEIEGQSVTLDQTITTVGNYFDYGEPVTIEAPVE
jgi:hypothetical protein